MAFRIPWSFYLRRLHYGENFCLVFPGSLPKYRGIPKGGKLEDRMELMFGDVVKLRDMKKEAVGRYQQAGKRSRNFNGS
ncbi:UNVERIFIED_CONTAM: hypothetical protein Slati_2672400 [Sesamum latifolium]|uniref:Uncharacterized protein n=1 Tax=Sesamum latifolium TaxID=2727402 RepID=A0AAW2VYA2_9LAMI